MTIDIHHNLALDNNTHRQVLSFNLGLKHFAVAQFSLVSLILLLSLLSYLFFIIDRTTVPGSFLRLFDVAAEQSIPTFFSLLNLFLSAMLLYIVYRYEKANANKNANSWLLLSLLFIFLSADESAGIHENFGLIHDYFVTLGILPLILKTNTWLPFGMLFVIAAGLVFYSFMKSLPSRTLCYFSVSGTIFIGGAIGFELIGAIMLQVGIVESRMDTIYLFRQIIEEGMEMYGIALFNYALYREICDRKISLHIVNNG